MWLPLQFRQQSQQYSMNLYDSKQFFFGNQNRTTLFPSLKNHLESKSFKTRNNLATSLDEKVYRMTSNQILRGIIKQNDSQIKKLRTTFLNKAKEEHKLKKIGQYKIIKEIGKGGFAQVYEVEDQKGTRYALKQYNLQNSLECYQNEAAIGDYFFQQGQLKNNFEKHRGSKHIIKFIDKFRLGKFGYIVQELGQFNMSKLVSDISGIFHNNERVYEVKFKDFYRSLATSNYLKKIMIELCTVVNLMNQEGFLHCDIKLENLMIQFQGQQPEIKIIDFGSSFEPAEGLPKITITPEYMPPELLITLQNGSNQYDLLKKVDVWSVGCILLELLTGIPLWFRYKCKVEMKGKSVVQLGLFALTGREYSKIVRKQRQLVENLGKIQFTLSAFDKYRPILKKLLVLNPHKRISLPECIKALQELE